MSDCMCACHEPGDVKCAYVAMPQELEKAKQESKEMNSEIATLQIGMEQECDAKLEAREQLRVANLKNSVMRKALELADNSHTKACQSLNKHPRPDTKDCKCWQKVKHDALGTEEIAYVVKRVEPAPQDADELEVKKFTRERDCTCGMKTFIRGLHKAGCPVRES